MRHGTYTGWFLSWRGSRQRKKTFACVIFPRRYMLPGALKAFRKWSLISTVLRRSDAYPGWESLQWEQR